MSILIKGMEMPKSCADCRLMADGWCYSVGLEQREKISTVKRPTWCPLVPVPPHGRLIDADALCNRLLTAWDTADKEKKTLISAVMANVVTQIVVGTPTIIPAEEGE